jgi:hypothetical protein
MTARLGKNKRRRKVIKSSGKCDRMMMLIGLLIGNKKEAVSAINVQANRKGRTGNFNLVTRT